jgi:hypothetical protein
MWSGAKISVSTTRSHVDRCTLPTISPTAVYIALEYWNALRKPTAGFADVAALTYSSRVSTPGSAARSAYALRPVW